MKETAPDNSFRRIVLEAVVIAALGALLGLTFHYRLIFDSLEGKGRTSTPSRTSSSYYPVPVGTVHARELLAQGAVAVDARHVDSYEEERLPGAVSLPLEGARNALPDFQDRFSPETALVVYCGGYGCSDSFDLGVILLEEGYRSVMVFEGGLPAWRDAGFAVEEGE